MADQPTALERFIQGILPENPVFRQLLGLCPVLAVTNNMKSAVTMAGAVMFVLFCAALGSLTMRQSSCAEALIRERNARYCMPTEEYFRGTLMRG